MTEDQGAPTRHPIGWQSPDFYDTAKLDAEMHRIFEICHGCRRCFNLCDSFPRLFDLIDETESGEPEDLTSDQFKPIVDACTLCDMCFMTMCPYTPPHEWNVDFPHLMLRYRAVEHRAGKAPTSASPRLSETDKNGKLASLLAPLMNWGAAESNILSRVLLEKVAGVDREAHLPRYYGKTLVRRAKQDTPTINRDAPAFGRKVALYATCFANYNNPSIGEAARAVLARNGVETTVVYPQCCGMPQLEQGDLARVAAGAKRVAAELGRWIDDGYDVVALVPSCALMIKLEWPLIVTDDEAVKRLAQHSFDITEYIVDIARKEGLADGLRPLEGGITLHMACHARAQNIGRKAADMLGYVPDTTVDVIERCSGHGGSIGVTKDFYQTALKVGRPVARQALEKSNRYVSSECPLAASHIVQGMRRQAAKEEDPQKGLPADGRSYHPIELFAKAYGLALGEA